MRTAPRSRRPSTIGRERGPATREEGGPRAAGPCVRADPSAPSRRGSDSVAPARRLSWCSRRVSRRALTRGDTPDQKEFPPVSGVAAREAAYDARRWHERGLPRPYHRTRLSSRSPGTRARNASRRLGRRQRDARCGRTPGAPSGSTYWQSCLCTTFGTSSRTARLVFVQTRRATGSEPGARIVYLSGSDGRPVRVGSACGTALVIAAASRPSQGDSPGDVPFRCFVWRKRGRDVGSTGRSGREPTR